MNPWYPGQADDIETAWDYAYESDPIINLQDCRFSTVKVDAATARKIAWCFLQSSHCASYTDETLEILTAKKKNLRIPCLFHSMLKMLAK